MFGGNVKAIYEPDVKAFKAVGTGTYEGNPDNAGEGGQAAQANIGQPYGVWKNINGEMFLGDGTNVVRKVAVNGILTRFAGTGVGTLSGDGGKATSAGMSGYGVCGDSAGTSIYVADYNNNVIRRVDIASNIITAFAGGASTSTTLVGNVPATSIFIELPFYCAVDTSGDVYFSESRYKTIRRVSIVTDIVTVVAGTGDRTQLAYNGNNLPATSTVIALNFQMFIDTMATMYFSAYYHNRVRKLDLTSANPIITTVAGKILSIHVSFFFFIIIRFDLCLCFSCFTGTGTNAATGDGGPATSASIASGFSVTGDTAGHIFHASNKAVRAVDTADGRISLIAGKSATVS